MQWPVLDTAVLGTMIISSILALIVSIAIAWMTPIFVNRQERKQRQEDRRYANLIKLRDKTIEDLESLERNPPGIFLLEEIATVTYTPESRNFRNKELSNYKSDKNALHDKLKDLNMQIDHFYKD